MCSARREFKNTLKINIYLLQKFDERFKLEPIEAQKKFGPRGFFIWFDIEQDLTSSLIFFGTMLSYLAVLQTFCGVLIHLIIVTMKKNANKFSKATYKLHK
jgi:hypothetical protein